ncbi:MAG: chloride channel protein [Synechococcus sp. ELA057]
MQAQNDPSGVMASRSALLGALRTGVQVLWPLTLLGLGVGLACLPLNLLDRFQDQLLQRLPAWGSGWTPLTLAIAAAPVAVMPLLLVLQARVWADGAGSGIPQTMASLEEPHQRQRLLGAKPTLHRLALWSLATLSLMPLGREGPVVQVGAAVGQAMERRWPALMQKIHPRDGLAVAAAAGLAGGFNTPFMAVIFLAEELTRRFTVGLIWPAMVVCVVAAFISNLGGQGLFALGMVQDKVNEPLQLLVAIPIGIGVGLVGALFGKLLLESTRRFTPLARRYPLRTGLLLGLALAAVAVASGGASGGDGEALMSLLLHHPHAGHANIGTLLARIIGPCLALGAGVPGGLIDPAFSIGAVIGHMAGKLIHQGSLGLALGMAASLAGATQLPALSIAFSLRLIGDQQLLPGVVLASVLGAYTSRLLLSKPIYHALADLRQTPAKD